MGRPSNLEKQIKAATALQRPAPPSYLTDDEAEVWVRIVNRMSADWFPPEVHDLLSAHCTTVVEMQRIVKLVHKLVNDDAFEEDDKKHAKYVKYLSLHDKLKGSIESSGTKLRINISSQRSPDEKKPPVRSINPHEYTGLEDDE